MRKLIAAINMTLDGNCDHTTGIPDEEVHNHFTQVLRDAGAIIYGRITYQLMESYWPTLIENPSGQKSMDDFAKAIDDIPKIVFSTTLKNVTWRNSTLIKGDVKEEVIKLKQQPGRDIFVGSPGMIVALTNLGLIDEYQLTVHPMVVGKGRQLFDKINNELLLKLLKTESFSGGHVTLYYAAIRNESVK